MPTQLRHPLILLLLLALATQAQVSFTTGASVGIGAPDAVSGDFDGDGNADVALLNATPPFVLAILGDGAGGYTPVTTALTSVPAPCCMTAFGDGLAILRYVIGAGPQVEILTPTGGGTFASLPPAVLGIPGLGRDIVSADFNGDGLPDLAVGLVTDVVILINSGAPMFPILPGGALIIPLTSDVGGLATLDADGDGDLDVVVSERGDDRVRVLENVGGGAFVMSAATTAVGIAPQGSFAADFDGNGVDDLAVSNTGSNSVTVLTGGTGTTLTVMQTIGGLGAASSGIGGGDLDGDGDLDLIHGGLASSTILFNNAEPAGIFTGMQTLATPSLGIAVADFDGNGQLDWVASASFATVILENAANPFIRGDANGDGTVDVADLVYLLAALYIAGSPAPVCLDSGDANDDGRLDNGDAVYLAAVLFSGGTPLAPYPAAGFDPTQDVNASSPNRDLGCN